MTTTRNELETRLRSLFQEQADATPVSPADWTEVRTVTGRRGPSPRRVVLASAAVAAGLLVAVVTLGDGDSARVRTGPAAESGTPAPAPDPATTAPGPADFHVDTRQVSLRADALAIEAGGKRFGGAAPIQSHSDPGIPKENTTLELTWHEHGVEMRLFMYFTSNGEEWWSEEIRTYDGRSPGDWITYKGEFFRRPLGTPFVGDFEVSEPAPGTGRLQLSNARLEVFRRSPSCDGSTTALVLDPGTTPIVMPGPKSGYGVNVQLLDAASCSLVSDQNRYRYDWQSRDPGVVGVDTYVRTPELGTRHAGLRGEQPGTTSVHVTATDPDTEVVVAELEIPVEVGDPD